MTAANLEAGVDAEPADVFDIDLQVLPQTACLDPVGYPNSFTATDTWATSCGLTCTGATGSPCAC